MKELTNVECKQQLLLLMEKFDQYCKENHLKYYLVCGTLLGAVRHGGFIPWDDDIDICMPREDYSRLILLSQQWNQPFDFICYEKDKSYVNYFGKIVDLETKIDYMYMKNSQKYGLFIDVFPLDYYNPSVDVDEIRRKLIFNIKMLKLSGMEKLWLGDSHIKNIIKKCVYLYASWRGNQHWQERIQLIQHICDRNLNSSENIMTIHCATPMVFSIFGVGDRIKFEHLNLRCPNKAKEYLEIEFGDYMKLPPKDKRVSNHDFKVYWKER